MMMERPGADRAESLKYSHLSSKFLLTGRKAMGRIHVYIYTVQRRALLGL